MNSRIKIFSKANMLNQYSSFSVVLLLTVSLMVLLNNSFVFGELLIRIPAVESFISPSGRLVRIAFFAFLGVLSYILILPFRYGRDIWFYENSKKNKLPVRKIFSFCKGKEFLNAIKIYLSVDLRKFLQFVVLMAPSATIGFYVLYSLKQGIGRNLLFSLLVSTFVLSATGFFFYFVLSQRYFLVPYLFYENPCCKTKEVMALSTQIMENRCFETAILKISFIPWMLLYIFIFPAIYVYPYYKLSVAFKAVMLLIKK